MARNKALYKLLAVLFWLAIWQLGAMLANKNLLIPIPTATDTLKSLAAMCRRLSFWKTVGVSLLRISIGFAAAVILGTVCALISARCEFFKILFSPLLQLIRSIPVASFTILVFLWISREKIPSVISFMTVFPIVWANLECGAAELDRGLIEMARVFGMPGPGMLKEIILPGLRPYFATAAANGIGFAWKSGVAAEVICRASDSIGNMLWASKNSVDYSEVFALTIVIVILSTLLQKLAGAILRGGKKYDNT